MRIIECPLMRAYGFFATGVWARSLDSVMNGFSSRKAMSFPIIEVLVGPGDGALLRSDEL